MARPYTFIFSTEAVDGRIAGETGFSLLSCREDFELQHRLRAWSDAVMVGAGTVRADDPRLTVRLARGRSPARVVVDPRLSTSPGARVYRPPGLRVLVTSDEWGEAELRPYLDAGVRVVRAPVRGGRLDLVAAVEELRVMGIRRLMVEGGGRLNYEMLASGLVDEVRVTVAPYVMGGGVSLFQRPPWRGVQEKEPIARLALVEVKRLCGHWVHLVYSVLEPRRPLG